MKEYKSGVVWLRRDLRLNDNRALSDALRLCDSVAVVFIFDINILSKLKNKHDQRLTFINESLKELNEILEGKGSQLIVRLGQPTQEIKKVVDHLKAQSLFFNEDYESYAKKRDKEVSKTLKGETILIHSCKDHVIFSGSEILKPDGKPYQIFTPYKRAWLKKIKNKDFAEQVCSGNFMPYSEVSSLSQSLSLEDLGFMRATFNFRFQKPGRTSALQCLGAFDKELNNYSLQRDYPFLDNGTSGISAHLRFGTISIRECVRRCINNRSLGAKTWLSELIWRDFYQMILDQYPYVEKAPFKVKYKYIKWSNNSKNFRAWCDGKTGFPIVDAGMRQLNETGWMHNRLRMITASFLVKDLLIDWKKGEKYFAEKLLDFDLASNNGGWQWCASTGCDAQPYFRVFNPSLQSQRFDADASYIKKWVPELEQCSSKEIHSPEKSNLSEKAEYLVPIVNHLDQKDLAIRMFKEASDG